VTDLLQRGEKTIQRRKLIRRGQKIMVAASGGSDSMTLLHALREISRRHQWKIVVAHFNHQLRGRSSDADEKLVRHIAASMKLPVVVGRADVKKFAQKTKLSIEMAARKLRHEFLAQAAKKCKIEIIALAHHADDQVELFFLRLLRGAGGEGLAGMKWRSRSPADRKITLIRPWLDVAKSELHAFARKNKIQFREDATNASLGLLRNRIRNELLPLLRRHYQPGLMKAVLRLMEIVGAESDLTGQLAEKWSPRRPPDFDDLPAAIQRRVLQSQLMGRNLPANFELIEQLREAPGTFVSLNPVLSVARDRQGGLKLRSEDSTKFNPKKARINFSGRTGEAVFDGVKLNWRFDSAKNFKLPQPKAGGEFFDAGKIGNKIILRHWRAGDRFQPIGLKSAVKLQDLFTNRKIPRARRCNLILATTAAGKIFWVEDLRISENFKLASETKRRLVWEWRRPQIV
jgi:tRNA(Ile)-lysidine synthase